MISVYDYNNYRDFIKDYQLFKLNNNPNFSFRYMASKAAINSPSFYSDIVKGTRNLTKNTILKTCTILKLSSKEAEYFENLVFFNQAKKLEQKNHYFNKIIELQKGKNVRKLEDNQYRYFSKWYHSIIREVITYIDFKGDYKLLGSMLNPKISAKQAEDSVKLLLKLGMIKKDGERYHQTNPLISSDKSAEFKKHFIAQYQVDMLNNAIRAYDKIPAHKRLTSATTVSISRENYLRFVELLRETRTKLLNLAENDYNPDNVYVLSMNLFSATETYYRNEEE